MSYSKDLREKAVRYYMKEHTLIETQKIFGISKSTGKKFVDYLENMLIPALKDGDIIVMGNMHSHHVKKVTEVIQNQKGN